MSGFNTRAEVSAEIDRLDALLGEKMQRFDMEAPQREFEQLMGECNALIEEMAPLYVLEVRLKREGVA